MPNIIAFHEFSNGLGCEHTCWLCQKRVSNRALFCHNCGTIQPVRAMDHFARLGVDRKVDVDADLLEQQYGTLKRTLDPERFSIRGVGERGYAAKHLEILAEAYDTLRDPVRRGRYWMLIHTMEFQEISAEAEILNELRHELEEAADPAHCDRVAQKVGAALQSGIMNFLQALREQEWQLASATLTELDTLENILISARERRAIMTGENI